MSSRPHLDFHGNMVKSREVAGFALKEILHPPGVFIPKHSHEHAHVGFTLSGEFIETFDRKVLECKPLSVSYISPGLTHTDDFLKGVHWLVFEIAPQRLNRLRDFLALEEPIFINGGAAAWLTMRLFNETRRTDDASSLAVEGLVLEILAELSRRQASPPFGKRPRWLEQTREILHAHFARTLAYDELAKLVGVHPVHIATVFRKQFGCTIGEYVRRLRVDFASQQLARSEDSLCDISLAAGFSDQSHFCRVFKQHTGMTPGSFRAGLRVP